MRKTRHWCSVIMIAAQFKISLNIKNNFTIAIGKDTRMSMEKGIVFVYIQFSICNIVHAYICSNLDRSTFCSFFKSLKLKKKIAFRTFQLKNIFVTHTIIHINVYFRRPISLFEYNNAFAVVEHI